MYNGTRTDATIARLLDTRNIQSTEISNSTRIGDVRHSLSVSFMVIQCL